MIDGFQLKSSRHDPDIPLENSNVYLKDFNQPSVLFRAIFVIVLILMLLQASGILR
ncbi:hypothetical protein ACQRBN_10825 [Bariatricus sp. SGI.154]|uniref:hypothetical protein n=1 Tax=Bariatricus sp. SGI.154 TaxID=3420549 RepID=UPI003CFDDA2E